MKNNPKKIDTVSLKYNSVLNNVIKLINDARRFSAKSVNVIMTATYWKIGGRIVEYEQKGEKRAQYGKNLLKNLSMDLTKKFGRGFGVDNLQRMRLFYFHYPLEQIYSTLSRKFKKYLDTEKYATALSKSKPQKYPILSAKFKEPIKRKTPFTELTIQELSSFFVLPWSAYVALLSVKNDNARKFYEQEALRSGWSVRQLNRQINSMFYERIALSKNNCC